MREKRKSCLFISGESPRTTTPSSASSSAKKVEDDGAIVCIFKPKPRQLLQHRLARENDRCRARWRFSIMSGRFAGRKEYLPEECNLGGHKKISLVQRQRGMSDFSTVSHRTILLCEREFTGINKTTSSPKNNAYLFTSLGMQSARSSSTQ